MTWARRALGATTAGLLVAAGAARAQEARIVLLPSQLPRPGYEPRNFNLGGATLSTRLDVETQYDTNIFATFRQPVDDVVVQISPRAVLDARPGRWRLNGEAFAIIREYLSNGSESRASFGTAASARFLLDRQHELGGGVRLERIVESRNDPEETTERNLPPRGIDAYLGNANFAMRRGSLGIDLRSEVQRLNYRLTEDDDRSLVSMRASLRTSYIASSRLSLFTQAFVNRRDSDLRFDRGGVNRDTTTLGATAGARVTINGRWAADAGVGVFRADPDDRTLRSFTGVAINADVTWSPAPRTAFIAQVFRGDVATVRTGAYGRVDTRAALRMEQEVRHNLLLDLTASYRTTQYRGASETLKTLALGARAESPLTRFLAMFAEVNHTRRRADNPLDQFNRTYVGIGVRLRH